MRSKTYSIGALAVLAFGLSACTDQKPDPINTSWDIPITTPTPTPTVATTGPNVLPRAKPPALPDSAKAHTHESAQVFVAAVVHALDWGYSTNDGTALHELSAPGCIACAKQLKTFGDTAASGAHFKGGHMAIRSVRSASVDPKFSKAEYAFDATISIEAIALIDKAGNATFPRPPIQHTFRFHVGWISEAWKIVASEIVVSK